MDRAHRLGQTRDVHVSKLVMTLPGAQACAETVEQRIMVMQVPHAVSGPALRSSLVTLHATSGRGLLACCRHRCVNGMPGLGFRNKALAQVMQRRDAAVWVSDAGGFACGSQSL